MRLGTGRIGMVFFVGVIFLLTMVVVGCGKKETNTTAQQQTNTTTQQGQTGNTQQTTGKTTTPNSAWKINQFKAGDYFKYEFTFTEYENTTKGWYALDLLPKSGDLVEVSVKGEVNSNPFSFKQDSTLKDVTSTVTMGMTRVPSVGMFAIHLLSPLGVSIGQASGVDVGERQFSQEGHTYVEKTTGTQTYAGVTGKSGIQTKDGAEVKNWCVNLDYPLPLHSKTQMSEDAIIEYTLLEARRGN